MTVHKKPVAISMWPSREYICPIRRLRWQSVRKSSRLPAWCIVAIKRSAGVRVTIIPKGQGKRIFRLVSGYRDVNATIEQAATLIPNSEALARLLTGSRVFYKLDLTREYCQMRFGRDVRLLRVVAAISPNDCADPGLSLPIRPSSAVYSPKTGAHNDICPQPVACQAPFISSKRCTSYRPICRC